MTDNDRQVLLTDQTVSTDSPQYPGQYLPLEKVDRSLYELVHPENAMNKLGMSSRTAYRRMDTGDLPYTVEAGAKRVLVRKRQTEPAKIVSKSSDRDGELSDSFSNFERFINKLPDMRTLLTDKELEIKNLQSSIQQIQEQHKQELEILRRTTEAQVQSLREALETERIRYARAEAELGRIATMQVVVDSQKETITSQKTTIDALNNERIVISNQLQKYRDLNNSNDSSGGSVSQKTWLDRLWGR